MTPMAQALAGSRLQRLAREAASRSLSGARERCDLCAQDLATGHRHLLDLGEGTRRLLCACRACAVLFDQREGRRYRLVEAVRDGRTVSYRLTDPQILDACGLMRAVLVRRLSRLGDLAAAVHDPIVVFSTTSQEGHP